MRMEILIIEKPFLAFRKTAWRTKLVLQNISTFRKCVRTLKIRPQKFKMKLIGARANWIDKKSLKRDFCLKFIEFCSIFNDFPKNTKLSI